MIAIILISIIVGVIYRYIYIYVYMYVMIIIVISIILSIITPIGVSQNNLYIIPTKDPHNPYIIPIYPLGSLGYPLFEKFPY